MSRFDGEPTSPSARRHSPVLVSLAFSVVAGLVYGTISPRRHRRAPLLKVLFLDMTSSIGLAYRRALGSHVSGYCRPAAQQGLQRSGGTNSSSGELAVELLRRIEEVERANERLLSETTEIATTILEAPARSRANGIRQKGHPDSRPTLREQRPPEAPNPSDFEEESFMAWLNVSDKMVEAHKDAAGWEEEPSGVVQRVRERFSLLGSDKRVRGSRLALELNSDPA